MSINPEVSVIIPVYNVEKYIDTCIGSVLGQTMQDFEIILVDDGSPDSCGEICDHYAGLDSRIKVIHKCNEGLGYARNSGLEIARGNFVCFLDSDDFLALNTLEHCVGLAKKENADEVRFLFTRFNDSDVHSPTILEVNNDDVIYSGVDRLDPYMNVVAPLWSTRKSDIPSTASSCSAIYRRSMIESGKIRFCSEREVLSEDYIFNIDFGMICDKIIYTSNKFYNYRRNSQSLTRKIRLDRVERAIDFSKFLSGRLAKYGFDNCEIYSMGYTIGELRSFNRLIFYSDLPLKRKKEIFVKAFANDYIKRIKLLYPIGKLPFMQRVAFYLHSNNQYWLSYFITMIRDIFK